jgi:hypothetical protein
MRLVVLLVTAGVLWPLAAFSQESVDGPPLPAAVAGLVRTSR